MKRLLAFLILATGFCFGQGANYGSNPDIRVSGTMNATCSNQFTTCDGTAGSQIKTPSTQGYGVASVTVNGTYGGFTINFEMSDDGGTTWYTTSCTRSDAAIQENSEAISPDNSNRAWDCSVFGDNLFRVRTSARSSGTMNIAITLTSAAIEVAPTVTMCLKQGTGCNAMLGDTNGNVQVVFPNVAGTADPCKNPQVIPSSVAINITSATTTQLVAPSGSTKVYVCGFDFTISQVVTTANTLQFITGSAGTCGSAPTATNTGLYGAGGVTAAAPIHIQSGGNGTIFASGAAAGLCAVTAIGGSGSFQGIVTFVQQ